MIGEDVPQHPALDTTKTGLRNAQSQGGTEDRPTTFIDTLSTCKDHQESLPTVIDIQLLPGIRTAPLS